MGGDDWRVALRAPVLQAEDDAEHDDHHDQEGAAILASALIGIPNLWQKNSCSFLYGRSAITAGFVLMVNGVTGGWAEK